MMSFVDLDPNSSTAHYGMGKELTFADRDEEAISEYKKAIRLNPFPPNSYFWSLGLSYAGIGHYEEAIEWCEKAIRQEPESLMARVMMTVVYSFSGRVEDARVQAAEVLRIQPKFSVEKSAMRCRYKRRTDCERYYGALRKAGLE